MLHLSEPLEVILLAPKAEGILQHGQELSSVNFMFLFLFSAFWPQYFSVFNIIVPYLVVKIDKFISYMNILFCLMVPQVDIHFQIVCKGQASGRDEICLDTIFPQGIQK